MKWFHSNSIDTEVFLDPSDKQVYLKVIVDTQKVTGKRFLVWLQNGTKNGLIVRKYKWITPHQILVTVKPKKSDYSEQLNLYDNFEVDQIFLVKGGKHAKGCAFTKVSR